MKHALSAPHVTLSEVEGSGSEGGGASQCDAREILRCAQNDITWSERHVAWLGRLTHSSSPTPIRESPVGRSGPGLVWQRQ